MSIERYTKNEIVAFQKLPLLQHGKLPHINSHEISNFTRSEGQALYTLGEVLCSGRYIALAYTQPQEEVFAFFGAPVVRDAIYISHSVPDRKIAGKVVVNATLKTNQETELVIQGCGSVDSGNTSYVSKLPTAGILTGYTIDQEGYRDELNCELSGLSAGVFYHETEHLAGRTILDRPQDLVDPRFLTCRQIEEIDSYSNGFIAPFSHFADNIREYGRFYNLKWLGKIEDKVAYVQV